MSRQGRTDEPHRTDARSAFGLDPRLLAGSHPVGDLACAAARLQDDARWPWLVLIPPGAGLRELEDLAEADRAALMEAAVRAGEAVRRIGEATGFAVRKLNVGALGNVVPQLHVHVIGRAPGDPTWPGPVWGVGEPAGYAPEALRRALEAARGALGVAAPGAAR